MLRVSSILKKSRLHGANRTTNYYRIKVKREKWYKVRRKRIRYKSRSNKKRLSPLSYITIRYVRLRGLARIIMHNRLYWKSMYPGIDVTKVRLDNHYKLRDACSQGESVLWKIESRLDVVLWRSGMVSTIPMAKQLVRAGKVELYTNGVWEVAKRSDQLLTSDIVMKLANWTELRTAAREKWTSKLYKHKSPVYRRMDWTEGIVTIIHKPLDGQVLVPSYLPIRVCSLMKRG